MGGTLGLTLSGGGGEIGIIVGTMVLGIGLITDITRPLMAYITRSIDDRMNLR